MTIKGLVGKESTTLGTHDNPWETLYVKQVKSKPIELSEEHITNYTYEGKPVYELVFSGISGSAIKTYNIIKNIPMLDYVIELTGYIKPNGTMHSHG